MKLYNEVTHLNGLHIFKGLIKLGCIWRGDIISNKWSEELFLGEDYMTGHWDDVVEYLSAYTENVDYKWSKDGTVFIA